MYSLVLLFLKLLFSVSCCRGRLEVIVGQTFPLAEIAKAHETISSRNTMGKTVLIAKQRGRVKPEEKYQKEGKGW